MMASVVPAAAPLFATVSFVSEHGGTEQQTFRVPIDATTTVKALAKSALYRLGQQQKISNLGIREIFVGAQQVKLFIHDIVLHVVNVAEERVVLVLKDKNSASGPTAEAQRLQHRGESFEETSTSNVRSETQPAPILGRPTCSPPNHWNQEPHAKSPSPILSTEEQMDFLSRKLQRRSKSPAPSRIPSEIHSTRKSSTGMPAAVTVASPRPIERPINTAARARVSSPKKRTRTGEEALTPEVAKVTRVDDLSATDRNQFIQQKAQEGWGREAYRNFESNYTSDPDKLARELRKQRALQAKATKVHPIDCDAAEQASVSNTTVPRKVTCRSPLVANENTAKSLFAANAPKAAQVEIREDDDAFLQRPSGWGVKASEFFDASTYHDDPSKAKLDPAILNEPVRARRSTRGPLFL